MIELTETADPKKFGFISIPEYGGGTWTNGRIHFFRGILSPNAAPTQKDLDTLFQMLHEGAITRTKEETKA